MRRARGQLSWTPEPRPHAEPAASRARFAVPSPPRSRRERGSESQHEARARHLCRRVALRQVSREAKKSRQDAGAPRPRRQGHIDQSSMGCPSRPRPTSSAGSLPPFQQIRIPPRRVRGDSPGRPVASCRSTRTRAGKMPALRASASKRPQRPPRHSRSAGAPRERKQGPIGRSSPGCAPLPKPTSLAGSLLPFRPAALGLGAVSRVSR